MKPNAAIAWSGVVLLTLLTASAQPPPNWAPTLSPIEKAVEDYAKLSGRVMLHGRLPSAEGVTFPVTQSADREASLRELRAAFRKCGLEVEHRGEKFAVFLPKDRRELEACSAWQALQVPSQGSRESATNQISFPGVDLNTALHFFGDISGRTILRAAGLPATTVALVVRTPLTHAELAYAFRVMLALDGVAMIPDGPHFEVVVPILAVGNVQASAPVPRAGDELYQPDEVPKFWPTHVPDRAGSLQSGRESLNAIYQRLLLKWGVKPKTPLERMVHFYASLSGQRWVENQVPFLSVSLEPKGPLTKAELLYALKITLALNGLYVLPAEQNSFRLATYGEVRASNQIPLPASTASTNR